MAPLLQSATTASGGDAVVTVRGDIDTERHHPSAAGRRPPSAVR